MQIFSEAKLTMSTGHAMLINLHLNYKQYISKGFNNKQLLNEVECSDIGNYQDRGLCYHIDNTNRGLEILYIVQNLNLIIVLLYIEKLERKQSHFVYVFKNMEFSRAF